MTTDSVVPPKKGEFCGRHFSWLCQAGQGKCQRGERADPAPPVLDPAVLDSNPPEGN